MGLCMRFLLPRLMQAAGKIGRSKAASANSTALPLVEHTNHSNSFHRVQQ